MFGKHPDPLFLCDPRKNEKCEKQHCWANAESPSRRGCYRTTDRAAARTFFGQPIVSAWNNPGDLFGYIYNRLYRFFWQRFN